MENKNSEKKNKNKSENIKSSAKAIGVKAVLNIDEKTRAVTSFGRGNSAVLEKIISTQDKECEGEELSIKVDKPMYEFSRKHRYPNKKGYSDNTNDYSGNDSLGLKTELEKMIFNTEVGFKDNVRVQIAYAIFDIVKVLSFNSNNITYIANHLQRGNKDVDIIGNVVYYKSDFGNYKVDNPKSKEKKEQFINFYEESKDNYAYYDTILTKEDSSKTKRRVSVSIEEAYNTFAVLSFLRNNISHFKKANSKDFSIFKKEYTDSLENIHKTINEFFQQKLQEVNDNFFKNEKVNFTIAIKALNIENNTAKHRSLANVLYSLSVEKTTIKMLGFSLKKLREYAIEQGYISFNGKSEQAISSVRAKLYKLIDLIVLYNFKENQNFKKAIYKIVEELRFASTEEEKEEIYKSYSKEVFKKNNIKKQINSLVSHVFSYTRNQKKYKDNYLKKEYITAKKSHKKYHDFTKLILYICNFLDGKEINELITKLINRFQVIDSFNTTVKDLSGKIVPHSYRDYYAIFEESGEIAQELFLVKSIARMNHNFDNVDMVTMKKDALLALGVSEDKLDKMYEEYMSKNAETRVSSFITNNVIKSTRFQYVVKYISPACVHKIATNKTIVTFVLNQLPEVQLNRYYESVLKDNVNAARKDKVRKICEEINGTSFKNDFSTLTNLKKGEKLSKDEKDNREKKKALLRLYFTVVYLVVKSLVKCNSLYALAFFFLERDRSMFAKKQDWSNNESKDFDILTRLFVENKLIRKKHIDRLNRYIVKEAETSRKPLYNAYRNNVAHLSAVSQMEKYLDVFTKAKNNKNQKKTISYFELYHFIMQRIVVDTLKKGVVGKKENEVEKYESCIKYANDLIKNNYSEKLYSQTLLRSMNLPFGYNVPRYKNLSYEKFFDRQRLEEMEKQFESSKSADYKKDKK